MRLAYIFLRGEPAVWFKRVAQPRMYRWNKFRSSLERNFGRDGGLKNSKIAQMILVRVVLADVRMQAPQIY